MGKSLQTKDSVYNHLLSMPCAGRCGGSKMNKIVSLKRLSIKQKITDWMEGRVDG